MVENMSKYDKLWVYLKDNNTQKCLLTFNEIKEVLGFDIDHSFLNYKKELIDYGYEVSKISMKNNTVLFHKIVAIK